MKFTFKTEHPTGRYKSFYNDTIHIKYNKIECGVIGESKPHHIMLKIIKKDIMEDGNPNRIWRWMTFKKDFESIQDAKNWINQYKKQILNKYNLYLEK